MSAVDERLACFIRRMPKVELHLHLEGSIRPATLLELARRHRVDLPANDLEGLRRWYRFRDFPHFIEVWLVVLKCLREPADFARITRELVESAAEQRVRYLQVTFVPATHAKLNGLSYDEVWAGIKEGAGRAAQPNGSGREPDVRLQFVPDFPRTLRPGRDAAVEATAEWAVAHRHEGVVGLGLGGYEVGNPPEPFEAVFRYAKARGLRSWPHAGETAGPESVWGAVRALGADRIAHGARAAEDPALLAYLAERRIGCDVCPTSNVCLGVYPSLEAHPIRRLIEAGVPVTVNSDDPPLFHTTLTDELLALARTQAFTASELAALVRAGVEVSFLPDAEKAALGARIDAELAEAARDAAVTL